MSTSFGSVEGLTLGGMGTGVSKSIHVNRFAGGSPHGVCLQLTLSEGGFVQLDNDGARELVNKIADAMGLAEPGPIDDQTLPEPGLVDGYSPPGTERLWRMAGGKRARKFADAFARHYGLGPRPWGYGMTPWDQVEWPVANPVASERAAHHMSASAFWQGQLARMRYADICQAGTITDEAEEPDSPDPTTAEPDDSAESIASLRRRLAQAERDAHTARCERDVARGRRAAESARVEAAERERDEAIVDATNARREADSARQQGYGDGWCARDGALKGIAEALATFDGQDTPRPSVIALDLVAEVRFHLGGHHVAYPENIGHPRFDRSSDPTGPWWRG